jgi:regulator of protease activity HflC (stomatin/prohibitin superfamily)
MDTPDSPAPPRKRERWLQRYELGITMLVLVVLFTLAMAWPHVFISIPAGHRGVLWSRITGTHTDRVYSEGAHFIWPWDQMTVYDIRYHAPDRMFNILSSDGLPIQIELTIRFKPSEQQLANLHAEVGPGYAETIVEPEIASALRAVIGNTRPEQLYGANFDQLQDQVVQFASPQIGLRHVILDDVLVKQITLPPAVVQAIERKFQAEQASQEMQFRLTREEQEVQRKMLEAQGNQAIAATLTAQYLQYKGIEATLELARSNNAKVVVIGGSDGLPIILNPDGAAVVAR